MTRASDIAYALAGTIVLGLLALALIAKTCWGEVSIKEAKGNHDNYRGPATLVRSWVERMNIPPALRDDLTRYLLASSARNASIIAELAWRNARLADLLGLEAHDDLRKRGSRWNCSRSDRRATTRDPEVVVHLVDHEAPSSTPETSPHPERERGRELSADVTRSAHTAPMVERARRRSVAPGGSRRRCLNSSPWTRRAKRRRCSSPARRVRSGRGWSIG